MKVGFCKLNIKQDFFVLGSPSVYVSWVREPQPFLSLRSPSLGLIFSTIQSFKPSFDFLNAIQLIQCDTVVQPNFVKRTRDSDRGPRCTVYTHKTVSVASVNMYENHMLLSRVFCLDGGGATINNWIFNDNIHVFCVLIMMHLFFFDNCPVCLKRVYTNKPMLCTPFCLSFWCTFVK